MNQHLSFFQRKPRLLLSFLIALFFVPLLTAWVLAAKNTHLSLKTTNHGQLLQSPVNFSTLLSSISQQPDKISAAWHEHWLLVYVPALQCGLDCEKTIFYLNQARKATGKDSDRVRTVVLYFNDLPVDPGFKTLLAKYPGTLVLASSYAQYKSLLVNNTPLNLAAGNSFIVDPQGNIVLAYPAATPSMDIFKDLTHLLKLSQIG